MNRKSILLIVVIIFLMLGIKLILPKSIIDDSEEIAKITIFNGNTGEVKEITDIIVIKEIISDFENVDFKISGVSFGRMGAGFRVKFYDKKDKLILKTIVNSEDTLRDNFFFYKRLTGKINMNRLRELSE